MVRQLGIPTWFCSFSSADLRWPNLLETLLKIEGSTRRVEDLNWADRCDLLRRHPTTAARMFDRRWHAFQNKVLKSPAHPIGEIIDSFYRVEFQQRGSPHVHCLYWVRDAPKLGVNTDEEVIEFIDKYVTCELPSDPDLLEKVTSVQQHSKRHSKTCKKGKKKCRFNFPRPPSMRTFIKQSDPESEPIMSKDQAVAFMTALKNAILDENVPIDSVESMFAAAGLTQETFEMVYQALGGHTHVVLKRGIKEVWINNYNAKLLDAWNANMDIQFVVDAWACIVYIISYISKAEREMGLLLGNAQKEASKDNVSAKEALKKLGRVYLHNRDVSAQEAVYRVTNMHLKECSRKVEFIPTGNNIVRLSKPINELDGDSASDDIWMTNIIDRFKSRPDDSTFNDMCIASFVSEYRVLSQTDTCKKAIPLQNSLGAVAKRERTKPAIVRYARFSETKDSELFHLSILQLFLPYRDEADLKPAPYETYKDFYENGEVCFSDGSVHSVKSIVDANRARFEVEAEDLDEMQEAMACEELLEEAWADLCPEVEVERLESKEEFREMLQEVSEHEQEPIPDLAVRNEDIRHLERTNVMSRAEGLALVRSLNEQQLSIFYKIRQWCLDKVAGNNPEPLHVFISGGAGTGKSHLIRAIQYEASRLLAPICHSPDNISVLLTAPTGIAAYNLEAATIHSTFSIPAKPPAKYGRLGEEKLNTLRARYMDVQIVIIDEISMVDKRMFDWIEGRLGQIKQTDDTIRFGNVCVIAVGDFYQLAPVGGEALYKEKVGVDFFNDLFKVAELKTVVRQQDSTFADLLNRLRVRSRGTPMLQSDIDVLKRRETGEEPDVLHIFPRNVNVGEYNLRKLNRICSDVMTIDARDFGIDKNSGKIKELDGHLCLPKKSKIKPILAEALHIGVNARVMLSKNIDLSDGLVNGVCGIVTYIVEDPKNKRLPLAIYVKFDDDRVGAKRRKQTRTPADLTGSTRIEPAEEQVNDRGERRRQFPLRLAWACTVHKVQGITVDEAVVSLKKIFTAGQAYVALSRVRSLDGLVIQDFSEKAIYCNDNIKAALENLPPFVVDSLPWHRQEAHVLTVFFMNIQGLARHVSDLASHTQLLQPNCIAVVETWLSVDSSFDSCQIEGYTFHSRPRSISYQRSNHTALVSLRGQQYGGVGMYCEENLNYEITVRDFDLECLVNYFAEHQIIIAVVYRPPSYPMSLFKYNLDRLLNWLSAHCATVAVMGDFNDDVLKSTSLCNFMVERGYVQYVTSPTTERGTLIDHFYLKSSVYDIDCSVVPTYFSDHEGMVCSFRGKCVETPRLD